MAGQIAKPQTLYRASPPGILWMLSLASSSPGKTREDCVHTSFTSFLQNSVTVTPVSQMRNLGSQWPHAQNWPDQDSIPSFTTASLVLLTPTLHSTTTNTFHQHVTGLGSKDTGETRYNQIALSLWELNQNTWRAQGPHM